MSMSSQKVIDMLKGIIVKDVFSDYSIINYFLNKNINGGWEHWLQVEFARVFVQNEDDDVKYVFQREQAYPNNFNNIYRCDLVFQGLRGGQPNGVYVWAELKTQRQSTDNTTVSRFGDDILKLLNQGQQFLSANIVLAIALFKLQQTDISVLNTFRVGVKGRMRYILFKGEKRMLWEDITDKLFGEKEDKYIGEIIIAVYTTS